jgi:hypothetical protein
MAADTCMALLLLWCFFVAVAIYGIDEKLRHREERRFRKQTEQDARRGP